jgi:DNA modification methylase
MARLSPKIYYGGVKMTLAEKLFDSFKYKEKFTLLDAYNEVGEKPQETIRARIYDNIGIYFERIAKGIYKTIGSDKEACILIEGDGRDLSMLEDESIDCILTDHPWLDMKSNKGGTRAFAVYDCFKYSKEDFVEKARVLKDGCFLVEVLPAENENNYEYLYQVKQYAKEAGFIYYSKVPWKKGSFVSNTGRKSKNTQDIMIFSKGKARSMRIDKKKSDQMGGMCYMSGCNGMLPTMFDVQPVPKNIRIHQSELPVSLCEQILQFVTYSGEIVLDSFAGSGVVGEASLNIGRSCILIEILKANIEKIKQRFENNLIYQTVMG